MTLSRITSSLPDDLEALVCNTIGCCIAVHRALGPGLNERAYARACCIELECRGIPFEIERSVAVRYKDRIVCRHRIDLIVEGRLIVEIKAVEQIHPVHVAQTVSYLRATGITVGLVANFNVPILKQGLRRVVL